MLVARRCRPLAPRLSPVVKPSDRAFATPFRIQSCCPAASLPVVVDGIPLARAISIAACVGSDEASKVRADQPPGRLTPAFLRLRSIERPGRARTMSRASSSWFPSSLDDARAWSTADWRKGSAHQSSKSTLEPLLAASIPNSSVVDVTSRHRVLARGHQGKVAPTPAASSAGRAGAPRHTSPSFRWMDCLFPRVGEEPEGGSGAVASPRPPSAARTRLRGFRAGGRGRSAASPGRRRCQPPASERELSLPASPGATSSPGTLPLELRNLGKGGTRSIPLSASGLSRTRPSIRSCAPNSLEAIFLWSTTISYSAMCCARRCTSGVLPALPASNGRA